MRGELQQLLCQFVVEWAPGVPLYQPQLLQLQKSWVHHLWQHT